MCLDLCGLDYFFQNQPPMEVSRNDSPRSSVSLQNQPPMEVSRNASPCSVTTSYDVFLSHSGVDKDFVEQLYVDLKRAHINVIFDKKSLPKGEEFPEHLRRAASTCKITVAVLSEDFFTRSSWPMAEIITSVEAKTPIIYPLFYLISSKGIKDVEKQQEWSAQWESWGMQRHNMGVEQWKATMKKIGITYGEEKHEFMSEVEYRDKVAVCINEMLKNKNEKIVSGSVLMRGETSRSVVVNRSEKSSSGSSSGVEISRIAIQPSNVVASSGSAGRQCGERFGIGLQVGLGVGVGQGVGLAIAEAVLHLIDPSPSPPPPPPPPLSRMCEICGSPMERISTYFMCRRGHVSVT